jgi:phosphatidylserine/phosphatidylglycerophosphate/cardiolipin synthase-like enzyme
MTTVTLLPNTDFTTALLRRIGNARKSIYVSAFSFNLAETLEQLPVRNLVRLLAAKRKAGIDVKVIAGTSRKADPRHPLQPLDISNEVSLTVLGSLGVPVANHRHPKYGSSHRKYVLVDEQVCFVGSHNLSPRALSVGNDDSVEIDDAAAGALLASAFRKDWKAASELKARDRVSVNTDLLIRDIQLPRQGTAARGIRGCEVELLFDRAYFSHLLKALQGARQSIDVAMFYFGSSKSAAATTSRLAEALVAARARGAKVRVLLDRDQPGAIYNSERANAARYKQLKSAGVEVAFDAPDVAMHSKLAVIDGKTVYVGSHNWTEGSVSRYQELSVAIHSEGVAAVYAKDLSRRHEALRASSAKAKAATG